MSEQGGLNIAVTERAPQLVMADGCQWECFSNTGDPFVDCDGCTWQVTRSPLPLSPLTLHIHLIGGGGGSMPHASASWLSSQIYSGAPSSAKISFRRLITLTVPHYPSWKCGVQVASLNRDL